MDIFDLIKYQTVDLQCPNCRKSHTKTIGWLKENHRISCACGASFPINNQIYADEVRTLEHRFQAYLD